MKRCFTRLKGKKGFTLMEVVVALAVVGIIAAMILPLVSSAMKSFSAANSLRNTAIAAEKKNTTGDSSNSFSDMYVTIQLDTYGGATVAESRFKFTKSTASESKYDVTVTYYELKKGDETK